MPKKQVIQQDGQFWFSIRYAAELLGTIPRKIEQLIGAGTLEVLELPQGRFVPEMQITELRRDPDRAKSELAKHINPIRKPELKPVSAWPHSIYSRKADQMVLPIADYRHKAPERKD